MTILSPLWPAQLDHIRLDSDNPARLCAYYRDTLGMAPLALADGSAILQGPQRRIVIGPGRAGAQPYSAFRLQTPRQVADMRAHVVAAGVPILPSPTPVFGADAFAVSDPDGRLVVFGLPREDLPRPDQIGGKPAAARLAGRLQHVVVATTNLRAIVEFYVGVLGFLPSDWVRENKPGANDQDTACFLRSDPEHHSFAAFRAPTARPDHHAYETTGWMDIRDWADHVASHDIPIWWGPGRHGVGNNLFFMCHDPQGYLWEVSAELEIMPPEMKARVWPHGERALNLWGKAFMRS